MVKSNNKCPFLKSECDKECVLFRSGHRYFTDPNKDPLYFEDCAFNILADCMENMIGRNIGLQQSMEGLRNEFNNFNKLILIRSRNQEAIKNNSDE